MEFGEYVIYVDESGDHSLTSIDQNYPIFTLAFCIFKKTDYLNIAVPKMQDFKFRWFGHDLIVLHESDIVKKRHPFSFLQFDDIRTRFMEDLSTILDAMPMTVIASVIRKESLKKRYLKPENPYQLALLFCMELSHAYLRAQGAIEHQCHIVCESRSPREKAGNGKEDQALELEFRRIIAGDHYLSRGTKMPCFDIVFASKLANSTGLQIADMIARPIGLKMLKRDQENRAFEIIERKIWTGPHERKYDWFGLKVFP